MEKVLKELHIDLEALATLAMVKEGILKPIDKLMSKKEADFTDENGKYKNHLFPFSFILAPSGKRNKEVLEKAKKGDVLDLVVEKVKRGTIRVEEIFEIDRQKRVEKIFGTYDESHPGVKETLKRLGDLAIAGEYKIEFDDIKKNKEKIKKAKETIEAQTTTAIMMAAMPLHRAHERLIRQTLDSTDLLVIFLLKPYKQDYFSYELRLKTLQYFTENFLPKNRVVIIPFENTYIFAGFNNLVLDSIAAKNFGCDKIVIGQNHSGIGMYYDKNQTKTIIDRFSDIAIGVDIVSEFVYCDECKTLVSSNTCPHGKHHHISYHSDSIAELIKSGLLPPAVLVRKQISAILLSELFPKRFKKLAKIYDDLIPTSGLLEAHDERDFYLKLMNLYQTTSLT